MAKYEGQGTFATLGGFIDVHVDIVPDPDDLAIEMLEIQDYLENTELPLFAARRVAMEDMQQHFDTESAPDGTPWADLDPDYLRSKISLGMREEILQRSQDLMHAAVSQAAWLVTESTLIFDTNVLPSYGVLHQEGTDSGNVGIAATHRFRARTESGYTEREGHAKTNLGIGSGSALPARPFIGLSNKAEAAIWEIFDKWFNASTPIGIHPKTGVAQARPGGKFGPRVGNI